MKPSAKRAQKGLETVAEEKAISASVRKFYMDTKVQFQGWCRRNRIVFAGTPKQLEAVILDFLDALLEDALNYTEINKMLAALRYHYEDEFNVIPPKRILRAMKGIKKAKPPKSRDPLPEELVYGIALRHLQLGYPEMAICILLMLIV